MSPTGIKNNNVGLSQIYVFPNPATNFIKIQTDEKNDFILAVNVYNLIGQKILESDYKELNLNEVEVKTEFLNEGVYFVDVSTTKSRHTKKIRLSGK